MNKNVFLWGLYDFANTPLTAALGGLYLGQWIVLDNNLSDIWYGGVFALVSALLLVTSPFWGAWSDCVGRRKPFLAWITIVLLIFGALLGVTATSSLPFLTRIVVVLALSFVVQYAYQVSLIPYNALLWQLSTPKTVGKVSGIGQLFGELGWLLGPAILLPFATGAITLWGEPGRAQVFIPSVIILALLGLPMIFWFREQEKIPEVKQIDFREVYKRTIRGLKALIKEDKNATLFLLAFMLVSDALLTATLYFAVYIDKVFHVGDTQKLLALVSLEVVAIASAYVIGKLSDAYGIKRLLVISCWTLFFGLLAFSANSSLSILYVLASILGAGFAGFYSTSRALLLSIASTARQGEYFGFYSTFQKFASILGPLAWGATVLLLREYETLNYRAAVLVLALLVLAGTLLMTRVQEKRFG